MIGDDAATLLASARMARRSRRFAEAIDLFDQCIALAPGVLHPRVERAGTLIQSGRLQEADTALAGLLADHPDHPDLRKEAGELARAFGRDDEAVDHFEAAAARVSAPGHVLIGLSHAARRTGRLPRALEAARMATGHLPESAAAWMALALAARAMGETDTEKVALHQAADADSKDATPLLALARIAMAARDPAVAASLLDAAEARAPRDPAVLLQRGHITLAAGQVAPALDIFRRAYASDHAHPGAATALIHCLLRLDRDAEAGAVLEAAAARFGMSPELATQRAIWLERQGRVNEARPLFRKASATTGQDRFARWTDWMRLELLLGESAERATCLAQAHPATAVERAAVARAAGRSAEIDLDFAAARRAYDQALALEPADAVAMDGHARLAALRLDHAAARDWLKRQAQAEAELRRHRGQGTSPSQTETGQIALELLLDRDGTAALGDILPLPPAARLQALRQAVLDLPESTAAAVWLLISFVQAGVLDRPAGPAPVLIPQRLLWLVPNGTATDGSAAAGWTTANPGLAIMPMDGGEALAFLVARYGDAGRSAWLRTPDEGARVDLIRLAWLAEWGGWTVPPGAGAGAPIGGLGLAGLTFFAARGAWGAPDLGLLGAAPRHPVMVRAAALAVEALARGDEEHRWLRCGPGLLARAMAAFLAAATEETARTGFASAAAMKAVVLKGPAPGWSSAGLGWTRTTR